MIKKVKRVVFIGADGKEWVLEDPNTSPGGYVECRDNGRLMELSRFMLENAYDVPHNFYKNIALKFEEVPDDTQEAELTE